MIVATPLPPGGVGSVAGKRVPPPRFPRSIFSRVPRRPRRAPHPPREDVVFLHQPQLLDLVQGFDLLDPPELARVAPGERRRHLRHRRRADRPGVEPRGPQALRRLTGARRVPRALERAPARGEVQEHLPRERGPVRRDRVVRRERDGNVSGSVSGTTRVAAHASEPSAARRPGGTPGSTRRGRASGASGRRATRRPHRGGGGREGPRRRACTRPRRDTRPHIPPPRRGGWAFVIRDRLLLVREGWDARHASRALAQLAELRGRAHDARLRADDLLVVDLDERRGGAAPRGGGSTSCRSPRRWRRSGDRTRPPGGRVRRREGARPGTRPRPRARR